VALSMVSVLAALLALSLLSTAVIELLPRLQIPMWDIASTYEALPWPLLSRLVPWFFSFLMFLAVYRWVPNTSVPWSAALWAALVTTVAWEAAKRGFAWYLGTGLARYRLVYGSLDVVIVLMFWIYVSAWITLFGAHLGAAVTERRREG